MKNKKWAYYWAIVVFVGIGCLSVLASCDHVVPQFSTEEVTWIEEHGESVEVLFGYEAPPNAFYDDEGQYTGLLVDFLGEIEQQVGFSFIYRNFPEWNDLIEYAQTAKNFVVVGIARTDKRSSYLSFTDSFVKVPYVIVRRDSVQIETMKDLGNHSFCTVANYAVNEYLTQFYPHLHPEKVSDNLMGLRGVSTGKYDAMILNQMYASYIIEQQGFTNLVIAGESGYLNRLAVATSVDDSVLFGIIDKAVDSIPATTTRELYQKWLGHGSPSVPRNLLIGIFVTLFFAGVVLVSLWLWNRSLKRQVEKRIKEIAKSRDKFRTILYSIGDGVITTSLEGEITEINKVACALTGWEEQEALGQPLKRVMCLLPAYEDVALDNLQSRVDNPDDVLLGGVMTLAARDGGVFQISESEAPIVNEQQEVVGAVHVFRDVTEEYRVQHELRENEKKFRRYIEYSPFGVCILNASLDFLESNKTMFFLTGFSVVELHSQNVFALLPESQHQDLKKVLEHVAREGVGSFVTRFVDKNQDEKYCSLHFARLEENYLLFFTDLTDQKRSEEELAKMQKLKSIGTLAGGIAHDFNNILMGIFGNISLAIDDLPADHPALESLRTAELSLNRATRLTAQLLTFAKGGAPVRQTFNLETVIADVIQFDLAGSKVLPVVSCVDDLWFANADSGQIQQVFSNLFVNAKQAMPTGGRLEVSMTNCHVDQETVLPIEIGDYLQVVVKDSGVGISSEHLDNVFDPYYTTKQAGSGLGLATVYSIISKHHGYISVSSIQGEWTTFTVFIPAVVEQNQDQSLAKGVPVEIDKNITVLLMDDEQQILTLITRILEKQEISVDTAMNGQDAIDLYQERLSTTDKYDLVILDLTVPGGMGGHEAAQQILAIDPQAYLVVSSGYSEDPIMANPFEYGFKDIIGKPYNKTQLLEVVRRAGSVESTKLFPT